MSDWCHVRTHEPRAPIFPSAYRTHMQPADNLAQGTHADQSPPRCVLLCIPPSCASPPIRASSVSSPPYLATHFLGRFCRHVPTTPPPHPRFSPMHLSQDVAKAEGSVVIHAPLPPRGNWPLPSHRIYYGCFRLSVSSSPLPGCCCCPGAGILPDTKGFAEQLSDEARAVAVAPQGALTVAPAQPL